MKAKVDAFVCEVSQFFNREIVEANALESGFVERESKLTGHLFLMVFTFSFSIFEAPSLNNLVGLLNEIVPKLEITRQGLHDRINDEAVIFFESMLAKAIQLKIPSDVHLQTLQMFTRILFFDGTSFQLPDELADYFRGSGGGASQAAIKILFGYDIKSCQFLYIIQDGTTPDNLEKSGMFNELNPGDLTINDLGFFNIGTFIKMDIKDIYYLSRLLPNVTLYQNNEDGELEKFDLIKCLKQMKSSQCEIEVYLKKGNQTTKTRLIIEKMPDQVKNERLRKINKTNKKKGRTTSEQSKVLAGFGLYITNTPAETIQAKHVQPLYAIRWQIELIFKNWKSNFNLAKVSGERPQRIKCLIYAKLLFIFVTTKLISIVRIETWITKRREVSFYQAGKHIKTIAMAWLMDCIKKPENVINILKRATKFIKNHCLKGKSKKRIYPLEFLEIIENKALA